MSFTTRNHYVPEWYQRRFLSPGDPKAKFFYLDLKPDTVSAPGGHSYTRKALRRLGPPSCFKEDHLYTTRFGQFQSDEIERRLFGPIDTDGERAVPEFFDYEMGSGSERAVQDLITFMDAQKLRTPKGLDFLRAGAQVSDHNTPLFLMQQLRQVHVTVWIEGVWEIVQCRTSDTKFIVSDHPVTTYNKRCFPGSHYCRYPMDAPIDLVGTHTIFPLGPEHCLIITNLEYVRDLEATPTRRRTNARAYATTYFDLRKIQTGRELAESDVLALNYIVKSRARRYVAAGREEWLYPERRMATTHWSNLGGEHFLMPDSRLRDFSTELLVKHTDGSVFAQDEYGRWPKDDDPAVKRQRDREWRANQRSNETFERLRGPIAREVYRRMM